MHKFITIYAFVPCYSTRGKITWLAGIPRQEYWFFRSGSFHEDHKVRDRTASASIANKLMHSFPGVSRTRTAVQGLKTIVMGTGSEGS